MANSMVDTDKMMENKMDENMMGDMKVKFAAKGMGLSYDYGKFQALEDVSLDIYEHRVTALIGPSGCGKSTFLKSLNRMNDFIPGCEVTGDIELDGQNIYDKGVDVNLLRKNVGMVFQHANPFPMSIYDNIAYGPRTHGIKDKNELDHIVEDSLKGAAIWDEVKDDLDKSAQDVSGGQQQRICIARALAVKPDVLLMDESTSALDPISTLKVEDLINELKEDYTIIIVTHNMQQAARVADYTAFFYADPAKGGGHATIVEYGETEQIFNNPQQQQTQNYVSGNFG